MSEGIELVDIILFAAETPPKPSFEYATALERAATYLKVQAVQLADTPTKRDGPVFEKILAVSGSLFELAYEFSEAGREARKRLMAGIPSSHLTLVPISTEEDSNDFAS